MKNKIIMSVIASLVLAGGLFAFAAPTFNKADAPAPAVNFSVAAKVDIPVGAKKETAPSNAAEYASVTPLQLVANPDRYMGQKVKFKAVFDKFSTLGLDYKPAFRDSQKYISFLIKRDDVTDHTIPLSEMKIFIKRVDAEKFIDLDSGDVIEVYGKVFSNALTDTWVDTDKLIIIDKKNKDTKKKA